MEPQYMPVPRAFEKLTGVRPHPSTCWRWTEQGSKGVKLKSWKFGSRKMTTMSAVKEFIDRKSDSELPDNARVITELNKELGL